MRIFNWRFDLELSLHCVLSNTLSLSLSVFLPLLLSVSLTFTPSLPHSLFLYYSLCLYFSLTLFLVYSNSQTILSLSLSFSIHLFPLSSPSQCLLLLSFSTPHCLSLFMYRSLILCRLLEEASISEYKISLIEKWINKLFKF